MVSEDHSMRPIEGVEMDLTCEKDMHFWGSEDGLLRVELWPTKKSSVMDMGAEGPVL